MDCKRVTKSPDAEESEIQQVVSQIAQSQRKMILPIMRDKNQTVALSQSIRLPKASASLLNA